MTVKSFIFACSTILLPLAFLGAGSAPAERLPAPAGGSAEAPITSPVASEAGLTVEQVKVAAAAARAAALEDAKWLEFEAAARLHGAATKESAAQFRERVEAYFRSQGKPFDLRDAGLRPEVAAPQVSREGALRVADSIREFYRRLADLELARKDEELGKAASCHSCSHGFDSCLAWVDAALNDCLEEVASPGWCLQFYRDAIRSCIQFLHDCLGNCSY